MTKAELYVHYYNNPILPKPKPDVVKTTEDTVVLPYPQWVKNKCACCAKPGASGIWHCQFKGYNAMKLLCASCGLREAFAKWNGFFSPKLERIDLVVTLTYQSRSFTQEELDVQSKPEVAGD